MKKTLYLILELILLLSLCACGHGSTNNEPTKNFTGEADSGTSGTEKQEKTPSIVGAWKLVDANDFSNPEIIIFNEDNTFFLLRIYERKVVSYLENNYEVIDEDKVVMRGYGANDDENGVTMDCRIDDDTMSYNKSTYERIVAERNLGNTLIGTWQGYQGSSFMLPTEDRGGTSGHNITFYNDGTYNIIHNRKTDWGEYTDKTYGNYNIINDGEALYILQERNEKVIEFEHLGYGFMLIEAPFNQFYRYTLLEYIE